MYCPNELFLVHKPEPFVIVYQNSIITIFHNI